jgi:8-oxo-dGTP pyrophosphatase MutT (NUDIX family)
VSPHPNIERSEPVASAFEHPRIAVSVESLKAHFARPAAAEPPALHNPHGWGRVSAEPARSAAVLVPIVDEPGGPLVLLTRRTSHLRRDPGNTAFPGGGAEPADPTLEATALRETHEEIGLSPERVQVVGRLGDFVTQTFRITPFVGLVSPPLDLVLDPNEVASSHLVPLAEITRSDAYQRRSMRGSDGGHFFYCLVYGDLYVGGPTVAILMGLYQALLETHSPA